MPYRNCIRFYSDHDEGKETLAISREFGELSVREYYESDWVQDTATGFMIKTVSAVVERDGISRYQREKKRLQKLKEAKEAKAKETEKAAEAAE